jgi:hypothetical protein
MIRVIKHYFPHIAKKIDSAVSDHHDNRGKSYAMHEAILSIVVMFLLKEGSRNNYNQDRAEFGIGIRCKVEPSAAVKFFSFRISNSKINSTPITIWYLPKSDLVQHEAHIWPTAENSA